MLRNVSFSSLASLRGVLLRGSVVAIGVVVAVLALAVLQGRFQAAPALPSALAATTDTIAPSVDGMNVNGPGLIMTPGIPVVLGEGEPSALKEAVADLRVDLEKVFGRTSPLYASPEQLRSPNVRPPHSAESPGAVDSAAANVTQLGDVADRSCR